MLRDQRVSLCARSVIRGALCALLSLAQSACQETDISEESTPGFQIQKPEGFPALPIPEENPPSEAKIELGRYLFYDTLLSENQTYSCGTCHQQALAFTDGLPVAEGSTGEQHTLGSMSLVNVAYAATLGWGNPTLRSLESQALVPLFGEEPIELGLSRLSEEALMERLRDETRYQELFPAAFPEDEAPFTVANLVKALATFQRTIISADSPYDRDQRGEEGAMSEAAARGMDLFFSERLECFHCHGGFNFSDAVSSPDFPFDEQPFHNNGMYNVGGSGAYPANHGVYELTESPKDQGKFKAPTLRNIAVTGPYLHDGSVESLDALIDLYAAGGRKIIEGENSGDGTQHPNKSTFIAGFELSEEEKADLIAFLEALTDETLLNDPALSDPYTESEDP
ncbi:MAG: MbnH family di-heme enzyme [Myxococcota bacterium]|nr:MbnH family di-heme enzyme [Myxococcota bacterium]